MLWLASHWPWFAVALAVALCVWVPSVAAFLFGTKLGRVIFLVVSLVAVGYWQRTDGYADGYAASDAHRQEWERAAALQVASASLAESEANRKAEDARAGAINSAAAAYEKGKQDALALEASTVAGLRAGNLKLREQWRGCEVRSGTAAPAADPGVADAAAGLREASAGRIVRVVAACQAERDALLKVAEEDRR